MDDDFARCPGRRMGAAKGYLHIEGGKPVWIAGYRSEERTSSSACATSTSSRLYGKVLEHRRPTTRSASIHRRKSAVF